MRLRGPLVFAVLYFGASACPASDADDRRYLRGVAADTWRSISNLEEPKTGLPYDNSDRAEFTSVSNIGIYLTSVVCAERLRLIKHDDALKRLRRTLDSVEALPSWFGFNQSWNSVKDMKPAKHDPWVSILDSGNLCAGLLTVAQSCPEIRERANALFRKHQWFAFYDKGQATLLGGYNTETKLFNKAWHLDTLGTDAALAQFFAIATRAAPPTLWTGLNRRKVEWEGKKMLWPGWEGGGLFMQFISGLWLDSRGTELGESGAAFAGAQVRHAKTIGAPVWGWSACNNPDGGYLGWASMKDEVVTPHACVLPVDQMLRETVANLRRLESLGVRSPSEGFFDAYNWKTKKVAKSFLTLDQGMLLISLANVLEGNCIRKAFATAPVVGQGRVLVFQKP